MQAEVLHVVANKANPLELAGLVHRMARRCHQSDAGMLLEVAGPEVEMLALRHALLAVMRGPERPAATSVIVPALVADELTAISMELANEGIILGNFSERDAAEVHVRRERRLVLQEKGRAA